MPDQLAKGNDGHGAAESIIDETSSETAVADDSSAPRKAIFDWWVDRDYVGGWARHDAFRELYQNWRDAIVHSFDLDPRTFRLTFQETATQIQILAQHVDQTSTVPVLMGFIRFLKKAGSLELTNFRAGLTLNDIALGGSSKRRADHLAGARGHGINLAALILCLNGHSVRMAASRFYWNWGIQGNKLSCHLRPVSGKAIESLQQNHARKVADPQFRRDLSSNLWEDVSVRIRRAQTGHGMPISEDEFRSWFHVALELCAPAPEHIISTSDGDLILDPRLAGRLFLRGLAIAGLGRQYVLGYNFVHGHVNCQREWMPRAVTEQMAVTSIWEYVLQQRRSDLIDVYIKLLDEHENSSDVAATCDQLSQTSVRVIWDHLQRRHPSAFFYAAGPGANSLPADGLTIIRTEFGTTPFAIPPGLWNLLRRCALIHTVQEERVRRFARSSTIDLSSASPFATSVVRALHILQSLVRVGQYPEVAFVTGDGIDLDLVLSDDASTVLVHHKWLAIDSSHVVSPCERWIPGQHDDRALCCHHVAEDLLDLILMYASDSVDLSIRTGRRRARDQLRDMPRLVQTAPTPMSGGLLVTWEGHDSGLRSDPGDGDVHYHVKLHKASSCASMLETDFHLCSIDCDFTDLESDLGSLAHPRTYPPTRPSTYPSRVSPHLNSNGPAPDADASSPVDYRPCECPYQIVSRQVCRAEFYHLDPQELYFPLVARAMSLSLYGTPPSPMAPRSTDAPMTVSPKLARRSTNKMPLPLLAKTADCQPSKAEGSTLSPPGREQKFSLRDNAHVWEKDEQEWYRWYHDDLPQALSRFQATHPAESASDYQERSAANALHALSLPPQSRTPARETDRSVPSLDCPDLRFCFETGEYVYIQVQDSSRYYAYIHKICHQDDELTTSDTYLLVTKYSLREAVFGTSEADESPTKTTSSTGPEVVLHFADFERMGTLDDAESIPIERIKHAEHLPAPSQNASYAVQHVHTQTTDSSMFCRFAIQRRPGAKEASLSPLASHLLPRHERLLPVTFSNTLAPAVYDFTPGVLGPSDGFAQAGFDITCGLNFDPARHVTWKIRHASARLCDTAINKFLQVNEDNARSLPPRLSEAKIALVSSALIPFRLSEHNSSMPSLKCLCEVLDRVDMVMKSPLTPDFVVMLAPAALLHPSASQRLAKTVFGLLEHRLFVHLHTCSTADRGSPLERHVLVILASRLHLPMWQHRQHAPRHELCVTPPPAEDLISDLGWENVPSTSAVDSAFYGSPSSDRPRQTAVHDPSCPVYNHTTGQGQDLALLPLARTGELLSALTATPKLWRHSVRGDQLTVRELARFQGLPDDFIFYLTEDVQYQDVWAALPPVITRRLAQTIVCAMDNSTTARIGDTRIGDTRSRPQGVKRARLIDDVGGRDAA